MNRNRATVASAAAGAALLLALTACGGGGSSSTSSTSASVPAPAPAPTQATTEQIAAADCQKTPQSGPVVRSGYGLNYSSGEMNIAVTPVDGATRCVQFTKSGRTDPVVPPDALLFTFAGDRGEGAQVEFLAVDLAGGILPWPVGASARTPGSPITATVGVSLDGVYYTSSTCTLELPTVTENKAAGKFTCPEAIAQSANPLDPTDDVGHEDSQNPAGAPKTAVVSGLFEVAK
ncbi:hypothetical protein [Gordonia sp. (in: high G+C Gram-positive bacteria)]|uniref:hypothetical protein n=1 Tax=Gordonia sp. (in: high G+C Gram-positive bacteria) TaxID=84139 RepID=UPI0016BC2CCE|nr:hypothetical protein [Gordonia sp. (in: high G+C Gram-positive bacteria)]NLG46202.1 hypothetical protein [Gordonia sp. (in: high G+C Gram-positive bacteria)]